MKLREFRIGWRLLVKEPAYSALVIFGLAAGFAACFLLLGLVRHSLSYDSHVPGQDKIYRLMKRWNGPGADGTWSDTASLPMRDAVVASGIPLMASAWIERKVDIRVGSQVQTIGVTAADPDFQKMFGLKVLAGDIDAALTRPDALALTQETATRLFGQADVVGKTVQIAGAPYRVSALLADPPSTTTMPFASLTGIRTSIWRDDYRSLVNTNWGASYGRVYVKLGQGATPSMVADAVGHAFRASAYYKLQSPDQLAALGGKDLFEYKLGALRDAYLDPDISRQSATHADRQTVFGLAAVAVLILLLATTNYVNLATVRTLRRQREIGLRKVLGASAGAVSRHFLAESVLVCLSASALGLLLAWLLLPAFSELVQRKLDDMFTPASVLAGALLGIVLGLAAGAYPTRSALRMHPTSALAGRANSETSGGLWLRRVLTVLQFATAMGLTALTLAIAWQTRYATGLDPGFDPAPLLLVRTADDMHSSNVSAFRDALMRIPGVSGVAVADAPITVNNNTNVFRRDGGEAIYVNSPFVSPEFFDVYRIAPVAGRLYSRTTDQPENEDKVVINAAAVRKLGFDSPQAAVGKFLRDPNGGGTGSRIIGVAPDLRHQSARSEIEATAYFLGRYTNVFTVRSDGDMEAVRRAIEEIWPRYFPNDVPDIKPAGSLFAANYADDLRVAKLLSLSSVIAIAIAAFGIYVLSAYSVQRRTREIVLRKLYGASRTAIARLVAREFAVLIGAGALIGLPAAYLATARYLAAFTERAPIGLWAISAALAVAALVAVGSTLRHTMSAVRIAPADALRD
jgi:putative ABC transport system permease protein